MTVHSRVTCEWGSVLDMRRAERIDLRRIRLTLSAMDPPPALLFTPEQFKRLAAHVTSPDRPPDYAARVKAGLPVPPLLARGHVADDKERRAAEDAERVETIAILAAAATEASEYLAKAAEASVAQAAEDAANVIDFGGDDNAKTRAAEDAAVAEIASADAEIEAELRAESAVKPDPDLKYDDDSRHVGWFDMSPVYVADRE